MVIIGSDFLSVFVINVLTCLFGELIVNDKL